MLVAGGIAGHMCRLQPSWWRRPDALQVLARAGMSRLQMRLQPRCAGCRFDDDVEVEFHSTRDVDERQYNLDIGQRVYIRVDPERMLGYNATDVDSAPLV